MLSHSTVCLEYSETFLGITNNRLTRNFKWLKPH